MSLNLNEVMLHLEETLDEETLHKLETISGASIDELSPDGGHPSYGPSLAPAGSTVAIGYESDQGQGLDLYGELYCAP